MKRLFTFVLVLCMAVAVTPSCKKKDTSSPTNNNNNTTTNNNNNNNTGTAKLHVTLKNTNDQATVQEPSPYATIQLFKTETDRAAGTNPATSVLTSDGNGEITISNLSPIPYYYNAFSSDGTKDNSTGSNHTSALTNGQTMNITVVMKAH